MWQHGGGTLSEAIAAVPTRLIFPNDLGFFRFVMLFPKHASAVAEWRLVVNGRKLPQRSCTFSRNVIAADKEILFLAHGLLHGMLLVAGNFNTLSFGG